MTPDVNVLVAASRDDHPHHGVALAWLQQALEQAQQGTPLRLQPMVLASFLRLVTHPKIFVHPTPTSAALRFVEALLDTPGVEQAQLGAEWPVFQRLCREKALAANQIPDAWLAAAAIHQGEHVVSFDADFKQLLPKSQFTRLVALT
ncbi:MAG: PIN domain-containing protein [Paucibacter sp.]|nr:PIN domain-containing protein [Roseateles sp.]